MKAAVLYSSRTPLVIEDVYLDTELHANAVLVRVTHAGVCHSDYHVISGDVPAAFPIVLGHEGAGIVEKVGAGVTRLQAGDHVSFNFGQFCGYCRQCNSGHPNLCDNRAALRVSSRRNQRGDPIQDFAGIACFAEYTVVLNGSLRVKTLTQEWTVQSGQAILTESGEWVQYSSPDAGGAENSEHHVSRVARSPPLSCVRQMCCSPMNMEPPTTGSLMIGT